MQSLNQCQFIGNVGRDPETRYTADSAAITTISIGCNWKSKDKEGTEWVRVVFYGKLAEIAGEYLRKGSKVYVQGRLTTRKWQDKEGNDKYTTEIVADQMLMLSKAESSGKAPPQKEPAAPADDDIPF